LFEEFSLAKTIGKVELERCPGVTRSTILPDAAYRVSAGKDGWTMSWSAAVISLRSEDVIGTPLLPRRAGRANVCGGLMDDHQV
jgi:hypothetical protein